METEQKWEKLKEDLLSRREIFHNRITGKNNPVGYYDYYDFKDIEHEKEESYLKLEVVDSLLSEYFGMPPESYDEEMDEWRVFSLEELTERIRAWYKSTESDWNES